MFYSSSCAAALSLSFSLPKCAGVWWNASKKFEKSSSIVIFLTNSQWYLLIVYGGQQSQPWEIKFKERDRRRKEKKGREEMNEELGREKKRVCNPSVRQRIRVYENWMNYWRNKSFKGFICSLITELILIKWQTLWFQHSHDENSSSFCTSQLLWRLPGFDPRIPSGKGAFRFPSHLFCYLFINLSRQERGCPDVESPSLATWGSKRQHLTGFSLPNENLGFLSLLKVGL